MANNRKQRRQSKQEICSVAPLVYNKKKDREEISTLYKKLNNFLNDRDLANMVYARYSLDHVKKAMVKAGYDVGDQGEHSFSDVRKFMHLDTALRELIPNTSEMKEYGFMDQNGEYVLFSSGVEAVEKAFQYNSEHEFKVATVRSVGDKYTIEVMNKTSHTLENEIIVEDWKTIWDSFSEVMENNGVSAKDIEALNPALINPFGIRDLLRRMTLIGQTSQRNLGTDNIELMLTMTQSLPLVQQLLNRYQDESIHDIAEKLSDAFADPTKVPTGEFSFMQNVMNSAKDKLAKLSSAIDASMEFSLGFNHEASDTYLTIYKLQQLNEQFGIDRNIVTRTSAEIKSLSDAVVDIMFNIKRQIANIEKEMNATNFEESRNRVNELNNLLATLQKEYDDKNFLAGLTLALSKVAQYQATMNKMFDEMTKVSSGDVVADAIERSDMLAKIKNLYEGYYDITRKLSNLNSIIIDEHISQEEKESIERLARQLRDTFENKAQLFHDAIKEVTGDVAIHYLGYSTENGGTAAELLDGMTDAGRMDWLYSLQRSSAKLVSAVGGVIREAQRERDKRLNEVELRINRATSKFYEKSKTKDTSYVYEKVFDDEGNLLFECITSHIDWGKFNKAKSLFYKECVDGGMSGAELIDAMKQWEYENTYISDMFGVETAIPIDTYSKDYDFQEGWSDAQKDYYKEMMAIKSELHSLMPEYAKNIFLAPQIRKSWQQEIEEAVQKKITAKEFFRSTLNRIRFWKIKSDDTRFAKNGKALGNTIYINGKECKVLNSTFDNNHIRNVPLFYVKRIEDPAELTHDFSQAVLKMATTALNYDAMTRIQNLVETMSGYIGKVKIKDNKGGFNVVDAIETSKSILAKQLYEYAAQSKASKIMEQAVAIQLYGSFEDPSKVALWLDQLLQITRLKALTLNVKGFIANELVGELQNIIEAIGGEFFDIKDYTKANVQLFTKLKIMDGLTNNVNSMAGLLSRRFNPIQEVYRDANEKRYYKTAFGKIFGGINAFNGYQVGEYMIHMKNMYAILNHTKVAVNGKPTSLMKVLKVGNKVDGNSELYIDDSKGAVTTLDGRLLTDLNDSFFDEIQRRVEYVNQNCHGAMNTEDKGIIHHNDLGRLIMTFRQWMVEHYSRRYRQMHYDNSGSDPIMQNFYYDNKIFINGEKTALYNAFEQVKLKDGSFKLVLRNDAEIKDKQGVTIDEKYVENLFNSYLSSIGYREGFTRTMVKFLNSITFGFQMEYGKLVRHHMSGKEAWENLSENQKYNIRRFFGAVTVFLGCLGLVTFSPAPQSNRKKKKDDEEPYDDSAFINSYIYRLYYYEIKRMMMEENASAPWGLYTEGNKLINQPVPAHSTLSAILYPIAGLIYGDAGEEMKAGKHKGENKYWKNLKQSTFPFSWIGDIEEIWKFREDPDVYKVFERQYKAY